MTLWAVALLVVALGCAAVVLWPLFGRFVAWDREEEKTRLDELLAEKTLVLRSVKDLENELHAGNLGQPEYLQVRGEYLERAVAINRQIADLTGMDPAALEDEASVARREPRERQVQETSR